MSRSDRRRDEGGGSQQGPRRCWMRAAVERGLDLSRSHCEETSFQCRGPHLLKMHTRLLPSHRGFPGQSSGQMRQLAKAVDVEMEKTRGFQLYFHSPP